MSKSGVTRLGMWLLIVLGVAALAGACTDRAAPATTATATALDAAPTTVPATTTVSGAPQLRIENVGSEDITDLTVLFPDSEVYFGDVLAGQTTAYVEVPKGVYRYAAYSYTLDGQEILQKVLDWVGELPMEGDAFTYRVSLDRTERVGMQIELVEVLVDAP